MVKASRTYKINTVPVPYSDITWVSWRLKSPAFQITSLFMLTSKKTHSSALHALCEGNTGDRWIYLTKGQWCGKRFHVMMSSWPEFSWSRTERVGVLKHKQKRNVTNIYKHVSRTKSNIIHQHWNIAGCHDHLSRKTRTSPSPTVSIIIDDDLTTCESWVPMAMVLTGWFGASMQWRHNERNGVSDHRRLYCLLGSLFGRRLKRSS